MTSTLRRFYFGVTRILAIALKKDASPGLQTGVQKSTPTQSNSTLRQVTFYYVPTPDKNRSRRMTVSQFHRMAQSLIVRRRQ